MNFRRALLWTLSWTVLAAALPAALSAGTVITLKEQSPQGSYENKIFLDGGRLRMEAGAAGHRHVVLYHAANGKLQFLDPARKTVFEVPEPGKGGEAQQAEATQKVMARKDLSAAQKEMILKNMKANAERHGLFGGPAVPAQYNKVASDVKVNGYTADEYEVILGGVRMREVWLADPKSLGIDPADAVAFKAMAERMGATSASSAGPGGRQSSLGLEAGAPHGVPVRSVSYIDGKKATVTDLSAVGHENFAANLFDVPADYKASNPGAPPAPAVPPAH